MHQERQFGGGMRRCSTHGSPIQGDTLCYSGLQSVFLKQLALTTQEQRLNVRRAFIRFVGEVVQEENLCCFDAVLVASILVLPLLLLVCDCYKQKVARLTRLGLPSYQLLARAIDSLPNLESLCLEVEDSYFNRTKAKMLEQSVLRLTALRYFTFQNFEEGINVDESNYSSFPAYFPRLTGTSQLSYQLKWDGKQIRHFTAESEEYSLIHLKPIRKQPN